MHVLPQGGPNASLQPPSESLLFQHQRQFPGTLPASHMSQMGSISSSRTEFQSFLRTGMQGRLSVKNPFGGWKQQPFSSKEVYMEGCLGPQDKPSPVICLQSSYPSKLSWGHMDTIRMTSKWMPLDSVIIQTLTLVQSFATCKWLSYTLLHLIPPNVSEKMPLVSLPLVPGKSESQGREMTSPEQSPCFLTWSSPYGALGTIPVSSLSPSLYHTQSREIGRAHV